MRKCPNCGSPRIHRSHSRGTLERLRKIVSAKRPHRCHACGWRGWGLETRQPVRPDEPLRVKVDKDFQVVDVALDGIEKPQKGPAGGNRQSK